MEIDGAVWVLSWSAVILDPRDKPEDDGAHRGKASMITKAWA